MTATHERQTMPGGAPRTGEVGLAGGEAGGAVASGQPRRHPAAVPGTHPPPTVQAPRPVVHFVLHVPKCAGTTAERHFERHLGPGFRIAPRWRSPLRQIVGNRYPGLTEATMAGVSVVSGHSLSTGLRRKFPDAEIREYVLLRDPVSHLVSIFNLRWRTYEAGSGPNPGSFAHWYARQRRNQISRFLLNRYFEQGIPAMYRLSSAARLAYLERRLARFRFVGAHTRADEMIGAVSAELGIPDRAERFATTRQPKLAPGAVGEAMAARIRRENRLDQVLYERWADRGWQPGATAEATALRPAPSLPRADHLRYVLGDIRSGLAKTF